MSASWRPRWASSSSGVRNRDGFCSDIIQCFFPKFPEGADEVGGDPACGDGTFHTNPFRYPGSEKACLDFLPPLRLLADLADFIHVELGFLRRLATVRLGLVHEDADFGQGIGLDAHAQAVQDQVGAFGGEEIRVDGDEDQVAAGQDAVREQGERGRAVKERDVVGGHAFGVCDFAEKAADEFFHALAVEDFELHPVEVLDRRNEMEVLGQFVDEVETNAEVEIDVGLGELIQGVEDGLSPLDGLLVPLAEAVVQPAGGFVEGDRLRERHLRVQVKHENARVGKGRDDIGQTPSDCRFTDTALEVDGGDRLGTSRRQAGHGETSVSAVPLQGIIASWSCGRQMTLGPVVTRREGRAKL